MGSSVRDENKELERADEEGLVDEEMLQEEICQADFSEEDSFGHLVLEDEEVEESVEVDTEGTELDAFESADIEETEFVDHELIESILESILYAYDRPVSMALFRQAFRGTNVSTSMIKQALERLKIEYAGAKRGVTLEEVNNGFQLRTKVDNMDYLKRMIKAKTFRLSGPALEVLSIAAYKQPVIKSDIDAIRGVESGHLLRGLMERGLVCFDGKSELPGKPMYYGTTKKFLEIFGLRNIKELPSLSEIDELLPEGIGEEEDRQTLDQITDRLSEEIGISYSEGEEELSEISGQLETITTSSEFFEKEKQRQKQKRDADRAQNLREAIVVGEEILDKDRKWLERYEAALAAEIERIEISKDDPSEDPSDESSEEILSEPFEGSFNEPEPSASI